MREKDKIVSEKRVPKPATETEATPAADGDAARDDAALDEALEESFPASDSPAVTPHRAA